MECNKIILIGNLTRDVEVRTMPSGSMVAKLGMASNRRSSGGNEEVLYIDVEAWNKTAELCGQYLRKGSQVLVEGRLKLDTYQDQQGNNRQKIFIVADRVQFGAQPQGGNGPNSGQNHQGYGNTYQQQQNGSYGQGNGQNQPNTDWGAPQQPTQQQPAGGYQQGGWGGNGGNQGGNGGSW